MTVPTTIKAEYLRATAAEATLQKQIDALKALIQPVPPPTGNVWTAPSTLTTQQLQNAIADMTIDEIALPPTVQLAKGVSGDGPTCTIATDRTARPLVIRPISGVTTFVGTPGLIYYDGQFFWQGAKAITMQDVNFANFILNQTGVHNIQATDSLNLLRQTMSSITLGPTTAPKKTWFGYIAGGANSRLVIDAKLTGAGRQWSGVQIDSTTVPQGSISVRLDCQHLDYAFYENVPTSPLSVIITGDDCGELGVAVSFHQATGTYSVNLTNSGSVAVNSSKMVAA